MTAYFTFSMYKYSLTVLHLQPTETAALWVLSGILETINSGDVATLILLDLSVAYQHGPSLPKTGSVKADERLPARTPMY